MQQKNKKRGEKKEKEKEKKTTKDQIAHLRNKKPLH